MSDERPRRGGISLRAVAPNAVTALALCFGLTGVRFAISAAGGDSSPGDWEKAIGAIIVAGVLDGMDGRIARMLKGESRFGAELDSLSDVIAFGVSGLAQRFGDDRPLNGQVMDPLPLGITRRC